MVISGLFDLACFAHYFEFLEVGETTLTLNLTDCIQFIDPHLSLSTPHYLKRHRLLCNF